MQSSCTSVFTGLHAPAYLTDELCQVADVEARQRLRSSSAFFTDCQPHPTVYHPSVTELFRSPMLASGTVCLILSLPHLPQLSSGLGSKPTCLTFPTLPLVTVHCPRSDANYLSCFGSLDNSSFFLTYFLTTSVPASVDETLKTI